MKVALVYTSTTPELIRLVEEETQKALGPNVELIRFEDPSVLAEVRAAGYVTAPPAARLITMFMNAVCAGADAILNVCSSVGEVADAAQPIARYTGIPIVRIDEEMCRAAVRGGRRIGVMATLSTTLEPTKHTLERVAREMGTHVELVDALLDGAFGLSPEEFKARMTEKARQISAQVDVLLFAQGSMAYCERGVSQATGKMTVSSPRFGAGALKAALAAKGLL